MVDPMWGDCHEGGGGGENNGEGVKRQWGRSVGEPLWRWAEERTKGGASVLWKCVCTVGGSYLYALGMQAKNFTMKVRLIHSSSVFDRIA